MNWPTLLDKMLDPYELRARLFPGLLVLLPAILYLALLFGTKSPTVVGLSTVVAACGGPYLLSSFVRTWGLRAQERLYRKWGAQPSTILLRHRDTQLAKQTKLRYHELATLRLGVAMPSAEEEQLNPVGADQAYAAAADALRPRTNDRKAFPFIFKELVAYGFNRNAYGSRWAGLGIASMTVVATLLHANALHLQSPHWTDSGLHIPHCVLLLVSSGCAALWCIHFTAETVNFAGYSYAKRLWEALEQLPKRSLRAQSKQGGLAER
jgi:hypothetical protein